MPVYEKIEQTTQRARVTSGNLHLRYSLSEDFCAAAWHALNEPIETIIAVTGQPDYTGLQGPFRNVHLTEPVLKKLSDIAYRAIRDEAQRTNTEFPKVLHDNQSMERLVAGCVNHMHGAAAHRYTAKTVFD